MYDEVPPSNPFLPILLVAASIALLLVWQVKNISQQRTGLQSAIFQMQEPAKQSQQVQGSLQKLVVGLLDLAQSDQQAKAVVDKYGIKQNAPAAP